MKKIFKNFFGKKAEAATEKNRCDIQASNTPEMDEFAGKVCSGNYAEVHKLLKGGFDPNQMYEFVNPSLCDDGAIIGAYIVKGHIMDVVRDEAMQKLLRAFGAKTSEELLTEAREAEKAAKAAEKEKNMKIVDELLAQK